jgi:chondroitin AC lyase
MKCTSLVIGLILCIGSLHAQADSILSRYRQYYFASAADTNNAGKLASSLDANGQWNDINYLDKERGNWKPADHLRRTRALALAYSKPASPYYHNKEIFTAIQRAIDHWTANRYTSLNWWHNEIGVPQLMRDILILLRDDLPKQQFEKALGILAQYRVQDNATGANLVWSADLGIHYCALTGNEGLSRKYLDRIIAEIKITTGDGVQPDYSFHQHDKRLQMYQYGAAFLAENLRLAWELRGTTLAFPQEKINLLTDFMLRGWQWMARGINTVPGTMDRSASRRNALHSADIRNSLPYLLALHPAQEEQLLALARHQNGSGNLTGFRAFPYSDFTAYQQPAFSFFLKTISTRTLSTESINSENLKGHLLNSGDAYFIRNGQEYFNLMPVWDWERLPGVTNFTGAERIARKPFVGSVGNDKEGFSSMDYKLESKDGSRYITAKKSWFCHNGKVVCLVGDLQGHGVDSAYTALDQSRWQGKVFASTIKGPQQPGDQHIGFPKWLQHNQLAYILTPQLRTDVNLQTLTAKWTDINTSEISSPVTDKVFLPVLTHTRLKTGTSFGYMVQQAPQPADAARAAASPGYTIVRNDSTCQAVRFADGTLMVTFYNAGSMRYSKNVISVDKPCMVMIDKGSLFAGDPLWSNTTVNIRVNGGVYTVQLPPNGATSVATPLSFRK